MTDFETMARQIKDVKAAYADTDKLVDSIRADLNRMDSKDPLRTYRDVSDAMDSGRMDLIDFAHAIDTRNAPEIGRLILKAWDAVGGHDFYAGLRK